MMVMSSGMVEPDDDDAAATVSLVPPRIEVCWRTAGPLLLKCDEPTVIAVDVSGSPPPEVQWHVAGRRVRRSARYRAAAAGRRHTLTVLRVTDELDKGVWVQATNAAGEDSYLVNVSTFKVLSGHANSFRDSVKNARDSVAMLSRSSTQRTAAAAARPMSPHSVDNLTVPTSPTSPTPGVSPTGEAWQREMEIRNRMRSVDDLMYYGRWKRESLEALEQRRGGENNGIDGVDGTGAGGDRAALNQSYSCASATATDTEGRAPATGGGRRRTIRLRRRATSVDSVASAPAPRLDDSIGSAALDVDSMFRAFAPPRLAPAASAVAGHDPVLTSKAAGLPPSGAAARKATTSSVPRTSTKRRRKKAVSASATDVTGDSTDTVMSTSFDDVQMTSSTVELATAPSSAPVGSGSGAARSQPVRRTSWRRRRATESPAPPAESSTFSARDHTASSTELTEVKLRKKTAEVPSEDTSNTGQSALGRRLSWRWKDDYPTQEEMFPDLAQPVAVFTAASQPDDPDQYSPDKRTSWRWKEESAIPGSEDMGPDNAMPFSPMEASTRMPSAAAASEMDERSQEEKRTSWRWKESATEAADTEIRTSESNVVKNIAEQYMISMPDSSSAVTNKPESTTELANSSPNRRTSWRWRDESLVETTDYDVRDQSNVATSATDEVRTATSTCADEPQLSEADKRTSWRWRSESPPTDGAVVERRASNLLVDISTTQKLPETEHIPESAPTLREKRRESNERDPNQRASWRWKDTDLEPRIAAGRESSDDDSLPTPPASARLAPMWTIAEAQNRQTQAPKVAAPLALASEPLAPATQTEITTTDGGIMETSIDDLPAPLSVEDLSVEPKRKNERPKRVRKKSRRQQQEAAEDFVPDSIVATYPEIPVLNDVQASGLPSPNEPVTQNCVASAQVSRATWRWKADGSSGTGKQNDRRMTSLTDVFTASSAQQPEYRVSTRQRCPSADSVASAPAPRTLDDSIGSAALDLDSMFRSLAPPQARPPAAATAGRPANHAAGLPPSGATAGRSTAARTTSRRRRLKKKTSSTADTASLDSATAPEFDDVQMTSSMLDAPYVTTTTTAEPEFTEPPAAARETRKTRSTRVRATPWKQRPNSWMSAMEATTDSVTAEALTSACDLKPTEKSVSETRNTVVSQQPDSVPSSLMSGDSWRRSDEVRESVPVKQTDCDDGAPTLEENLSVPTVEESKPNPQPAKPKPALPVARVKPIRKSVKRRKTPSPAPPASTDVVTDCGTQGTDVKVSPPTAAESRAIPGAEIFPPDALWELCGEKLDSVCRRILSINETPLPSAPHPAGASQTANVDVEPPPTAELEGISSATSNALPLSSDVATDSPNAYGVRRIELRSSAIEISAQENTSAAPALHSADDAHDFAFRPIDAPIVSSSVEKVSAEEAATAMITLQAPSRRVEAAETSPSAALEPSPRNRVFYSYDLSALRLSLLPDVEQVESVDKTDSADDSSPGSNSDAIAKDQVTTDQLASLSSHSYTSTLLSRHKVPTSTPPSTHTSVLNYVPSPYASGDRRQYNAGAEPESSDPWQAEEPELVDLTDKKNIPPDVVISCGRATDHVRGVENSANSSGNAVAGDDVIASDIRAMLSPTFGLRQIMDTIETLTRGGDVEPSDVVDSAPIGSAPMPRTGPLFTSRVTGFQLTAGSETGSSRRPLDEAHDSGVDRRSVDELHSLDRRSDDDDDVNSLDFDVESFDCDLCPGTVDLSESVHLAVPEDDDLDAYNEPDLDDYDF